MLHGGGVRERVPEKVLVEEGFLEVAVLVKAVEEVANVCFPLMVIMILSLMLLLVLLLLLLLMSLLLLLLFIYAV